MYMPVSLDAASKSTEWTNSHSLPEKIALYFRYSSDLVDTEVSYFAELGVKI